MSRNKPVEDLRIGRVRAAIWKNESEKGTYYSVTFSKLFKDSEGQWKDTGSFNRDELMLVAKVADMAHTYLYSQPVEKNGEQKKEDEPGNDDE